MDTFTDLYDAVVGKDNDEIIYKKANNKEYLVVKTKDKKTKRRYKGKYSP